MSVYIRIGGKRVRTIFTKHITNNLNFHDKSLCSVQIHLEGRLPEHDITLAASLQNIIHTVAV